MGSEWEATVLGPSVLENSPEGGEHLFPHLVWEGVGEERWGWGGSSWGLVG